MKKRFSIIITFVLMVSILSVSVFANNTGGMQPTASPKMQQKTMKGKDIVDIASNNGSFGTLVAALKAAGLVDTLKGDGPFTVFAPTDDAFAKLPASTIEDLLKPENKDNLIKILTYHVIPGKITAADVMKLDGKEITMLNGQKAKVTVKDGAVYIDNAKVIIPDVMAKNGVIHVIDTVLLPPMN
ncbi:MAG: fasciclin domain-containing protein [Cellulosilyticaceae bacterium]